MVFGGFQIKNALNLAFEWLKKPVTLALGKALFGERSFGVVSDFGFFALRINSYRQSGTSMDRVRPKLDGL